VIVFDRGGSAPRISGTHYWTINKHSFNKSAADSLYLQSLCDKFNVSFFVSTYYTTPTETPSFFMGYDMIPEILGFPLEDQTWKEKDIAILSALKHGMISLNSIQDLKTIYPHLESHLISHLPLGVDPNIYRSNAHEESHFLERHSLQRGKFILLVGERLGYYGYKNCDLVIKALSLNKSPDFSILCVGGQETIEDELIRINPNIKISRISATDEDLRAAYSTAHCLIYPSKYEGFGLPPLEAMACGCPVITCNNSSISEVAGNAAIYVNEEDPSETLNAIDSLRLLQVREDFIKRGYQQVEKFNFGNTADKLFHEICSMDTFNNISMQATRGLINSFRINQSQLQLDLIASKVSSLKNVELSESLKKKIDEINLNKNKDTLDAISRLSEVEPKLLLDRLSTSTLFLESSHRLQNYPLRLIKRLLPHRLKLIIKNLLNQK
jgi:glycosyltransferase involved in cell wall biosynthesis